jgi:hypothetical protein
MEMIAHKSQLIYSDAITAGDSTDKYAKCGVIRYNNNMQRTNNAAMYKAFMLK